MVRRDRAKLWRVQAFRIGIRTSRDIWKYGPTNAVPPQRWHVRQISEALENRSHLTFRILPCNTRKCRITPRRTTQAPISEPWL
jgi:hypothetical protein